MNYIETAREILATKIEVEPELLDFYTLLALTTGTATHEKHVHDAWAIWRDKTNPEHKSLIPFEKLSDEVQQMDTEYVDAIVSTAKQLKDTRSTAESANHVK